MRFKVQPEDFVVEEQVHLPLASTGRFAVYRVRKRGVTTLRVRTSLAQALGLPESAVAVPALKDKDAIAVQHVAVQGTGPTRLNGDGFDAMFVGRSSRPLSPADITANHFTVVLRELSPEEATRVGDRLDGVVRSGLPNYFDQQRFGSIIPGTDCIGKRILRRDAEGALRSYLSHPFAGDPARVRRFKAIAAAHWGDWDTLFEAAPRPSNFRSVLTYLRDHPSDDAEEQARHYRKALNLITRRLLSLYLAAFQSLLWNRTAACYLRAGLGPALAHLEIADERLPIHADLASHVHPELAISLPHHRAVYAEPELERCVAQVLAEEGLAIDDLKARILKRAYLAKGKRALLLFPQEASASVPEPDDRFPGWQKLSLAFTLPRGSYATVVIKALAL